MSNSEHSKHENTDEDSEISIDFSKFKKFFSTKFAKVLFLILLIAIPVVLTAYIRLQPASLPATDDWAKSSVENYYKNQISQSVYKQYPNLPVAQRNKLVDEQYATFVKENKDSVAQQITQTSEYFKTGMQYQENNNTYTFLGDLDSYYYLRQARNIEEKGTICDYVDETGACIDNHMRAPLNGGVGPSLHPYATVYLHQFLHFFNPKINLMQAAFILPTIIAIIAAICAFFIGRKLMNNTAGFFAAMFIATSPLIITRTLGSDTDIWNITFPLIIIWLFLEAFDSKTLIKKISLTVVTGFAMACFNFAWGGWWYIFYFTIAALLGHLGFIALKKYVKHRSIKHIFDKELRDDLIILGTLFISTMMFITIIYSFNSFTSAMAAPFVFNSGLKTAAVSDLWPNVLTTVAELNDANISTIISQASFGITALFALALLGIILTLVRKEPKLEDYLLIGISALLYLYLISPKGMLLNYKLYLFLVLAPILLGLWFILKDDKTRDIKPALILMIWMIGMIYTSIKGVRFILLLIPAFSIGLGVAIGYIYQYLKRTISNGLKISEIITKIIVVLILCLILIAPISIGISSGKSYVPSMTKGWWDSLIKIREQSKPDAILTSWWDFGHWFKYVADRRVTFDGASQLPPLAHWAGESLLTNNETETVGILKMLACGSNNAFEEINKKYNDTEKSQNIVAEIILLSKEDAKKYLTKIGFSDNEITNVLNYSHCNPPEVYYITSEDMVGKAGVWGHFGSWDIDKAYVINEVRPKSLEEGTRLLKERFNYTDDEAAKIYYDVQALQTDREMNDWIAPWPSYATTSIPCSNYSDLVLCDMRITIGNNGQQNIVLERAVINLTDPKSSQVLMGIYAQSTNARVGENVATWSKVVIADSKIKTYIPNNVTIGLGILLNIEKNNNVTTYNAIVSDPLLVDSTFTKLFFLEGKGTTHFEKFSDITDITGSRIIIWKVKW